METFQPCTITLSGKEAVSSGLLCLQPLQNQRNQALEDQYLLSSSRSHPPDSSPLSHHATPRHLSSHLHPHKVNKDLHLRGKPQIVQPEVVDPRLLGVKTKMAATI